MNGNHSAEELLRQAAQHAHSAALSAQRSAQKSEAATNALLEVHQSLGGVMREVSDLKREMHEGFKKLTKTRAELRSLSDEFEDTKTHDLRIQIRQHKKRETWLLGIAGTVIGGLIIAFVTYLLHLK